MDKIKFAELVSYVSTITGSHLDLYIIDRLNTLTASVGNNTVNLVPLFDALASGRKIDAIKEHRRLTGFGLKESKDEVERVYGLAPAAWATNN